jgi:hypothetical protein
MQGAVPGGGTAKEVMSRTEGEHQLRPLSLLMAKAFAAPKKKRLFPLAGQAL